VRARILSPMLLNRLEKAFMNNPVRALVQRHVEARWLLEMGGGLGGGHALELGCGRGVGTELIFEQFGAARVDALDLDPEMIRLARKRLRGRDVRIFVGDAEHIDAADGTYDAAFDFAIIHHIPAWRNAVHEVFRVLRPGARFYVEEVLARFIHHPLWRRLLDHPMHDRFDHDGFTHGLTQAGFIVKASRDVLGQFAFFVAEKPL
jgi:ubiquinone/menaquinone biosynthesis C-methylase UbiE